MDKIVSGEIIELYDYWNGFPRRAKIRLDTPSLSQNSRTNQKGEYDEEFFKNRIMILLSIVGLIAYYMLPLPSQIYGILINVALSVNLGWHIADFCTEARF